MMEEGRSPGILKKQRANSGLRIWVGKAAVRSVFQSFTQYEIQLLVLYSVHQAQGCFETVESYSSSDCRNVTTHFRQEPKAQSPPRIYQEE
jgi:hypothetical protein